MKSRSLFTRFSIMTIIIIIFQSLLLVSVYFWGTYGQLNSNNITDIKRYLEYTKQNYLTNMEDKWNIIKPSKLIQEEIYFLQQTLNVSDNELINNDNYTYSLFNDLRDDINQLNSNCDVDDVFLILNQERENKDAIYLRNRGNRISLEICPTNQQKYFLLDLNFDASNQLEDTINLSDLDSDAFFTEFLEKEKISSNVGLWNYGLNVHQNSGNLTYSFPLFGLEGSFLGVIGIGINEETLQKNIFSFSEYKDPLGIYLLQQNASERNNQVYNVISSDENGIKILNEKKLDYYNNEYSELYGCSNITLDTKERYLFVNIEFDVNQFFYQDLSTEKWSIGALVTEEYIVGRNNYLFFQIILYSFIGLLLCLGFSFIYIKYHISPIKKVASQIEERKSYLSFFSFDKTNIKEIDVMLNEISSLIQKNADITNQIGIVLEQANIPMVFFMTKNDETEISIAGNIREMFGRNDIIVNDKFEFEKFLRSYREQIIDCIEFEKEYIYYLKDVRDGAYVYLKIIETNNGFDGYLMDISRERKELELVKNIQNHDYMTGLLNRSGFEGKIQTMLDENKCDHSAIMMIDLNKLKRINDHYGHEIGDRYIIEFAKNIKLSSSSDKIIPAHLSGDEFIVLFYNYDSEESLINAIEEFNKSMYSRKLVLLPDLQLEPSFASGVALASQGDYVFATIKRYADFAMYNAKEKNDGNVSFFSKEIYSLKQLEELEKDSFLRMLSNDEIEYYFQPILNMNTGEIYGYEALMRPQNNEFSSPLKVLDLAKKYDYLNYIEEITFKKAPDTFRKFKSNKKLFINSLKDEILSEDKRIDFFKSNHDILSNIIIELTETEQTDLSSIQGRIKLLNLYDVEIAIDDFGSNYNTMEVLIGINPNYIKISRNIVAHCDTQYKNLSMLVSIVSFCKANNIKIIAEGIETNKEFLVCYLLGIDYAQGFLLGKATEYLIDECLTGKVLLNRYRQNQFTEDEIIVVEAVNKIKSKK